MTVTEQCLTCPEQVQDSPDGWHNDESGMDCPGRWTTDENGEPVPGPHKTTSDRYDNAQMKNLVAFSEKIRTDVPAAVSAQVTSSDQGLYGFVLLDVLLHGGELLSDEDPALLDALTNDTAVQEPLNDLDWNGLVRENKHGDAVIPLRQTA